MSELKKATLTIDKIKERLNEEIKRCGLKKKDIAKAVGVSSTMFSKYEKTKKMPSLETFARICQVLDLDANYVLGII